MTDLEVKIEMNDLLIYALVVTKTLNLVFPSRCFAEHGKETFKIRSPSEGASNWLPLVR